MINFLVGRQSANIQQEIINEMVEHYRANAHQMHFLIVPNHIKFGTEVAALKTLSARSNREEVSVKNFQVLSFSRLAWYFLKEAGQNILPGLTDAAAQMLIRQIMSEHQSELLLYDKVKLNQGTISQVYQSISELKTNNLTTPNLVAVVNDIKNQETSAKLHDLSLIMELFNQEIESKFSTKNDTLNLLNEVLATSDLLRDSQFYFSDFSSFSSQETTTVKILLQQAGNVSLGFKTQTCRIKESAPKMTDYDWNVQRVIHELMHFTRNKKLSYRIESAELTATSQSIKLLNKFWTGEQQHLDATERALVKQSLQLVKADSRYSEAYFVAHTIYQQVALNNARYADFLVLAPNLSSYETYLGPILEQLDIPYFNDLQKEMKYHPLVIMIEALADLNRHHLNTDSLISIFKTGLILPANLDAEHALYLTDQLENFVLKYGINHQRWHTDFKTLLDLKVAESESVELVKELNDFKNYVLRAVESLLECLSTTTDTREVLTEFYQFLDDNDVPKRLEEWRDQANAADNLQLAQQPEQVWQTLNQLLNDYLTINPVNFDRDSFFETLITGFSTATFAQIPSTLDAVTISEMGMAQTNEYQQCFIIGATSGDLPATKSTPKFLNSENITDLNRLLPDEKQITDSTVDNNCIQAYQFGQNLLLGRMRVYLSYPLINAENKALKPSMYFTKLMNALGVTEANLYHQTDLPATTGGNIIGFLTKPLNSAGYLAYLLKHTSNNMAQSLLQVAQNSDDALVTGKINRLLMAQNFINRSVDLTTAEANALFGNKIYTSVSQLETYYENPYEYFLKYGLRLRERDENEFDQIQTGNYFHEIFDLLVKNLTANHLDLGAIKHTHLMQALQQITSRLKEEQQFKFFLAEPTNRYLASQLDQTATEVVNNWVAKLQRTPLRPAFSELTFGQGSHLKGLNYDFDGHQIMLRGKIDRIDLATVNNTTYAQIVDYKSSTKEFDLNSFYNGLALQMVSYLKVLMQNKAYFTTGTSIIPVGAFYQTISRKPDKFGTKKINPDFTLHDFEHDFILNSRLDGLILNDPGMLSIVEPDLNGQSTIYKSVQGTSKGIKLPKNKNYTSEQLKLIFDYTDYLIKLAGRNILAGKFPIAPFKYGALTGMQYSNYKEIMMFDAMLQENQYKKIQKKDSSELFNQMKGELGDE